MKSKTPTLKVILTMTEIKPILTGNVGTRPN